MNKRIDGKRDRGTKGETERETDEQEERNRSTEGETEREP